MSSECSCKTKSTGIFKRARFDLVNAKPYSLDQEQMTLMIKEASSKIETDGSSKINLLLKEQMAKHPTALFFKAKAIEANIPNNNGDHFNEKELKKAVNTFVGVPFFTNHQNSDVEKAKGKIVYAEWNDEDKAIYVIAFVDREAYPHLCRGIEEGYVNGVSMGSLGGESVIKMADFSSKKIIEVKVGDKVLTPFGNLCEVEKIYSAVLGKPMYRLNIVGYKNSPLFSGDHPVYIVKNKLSDPEFVEVRDLISGNYILFPIFKGSKLKKSLNRIFVEKDGKKFIGCPLKSVTEVPFEEKSYDLKVKGDESYIANGIAVHNCSVEYSVCSICGNRAASQEEYCFVGGTPIVMSDYTVKNIEDIKETDEVIDAFGNKTKVIKTFKRTIDEDVQSIFSRSISNELICTKNHPFLTIRRGEYIYVPSEFLNDKENLLTPIPKNNKDDSLFEKSVNFGFKDSEDNRKYLCKLIGYYMAEGCILHDKNKIDIGFELSFGSDETELINDVKIIIKKLFDYDVEICDRNIYNRKSVSIRLYNKVALEIIKNTVFGKAKNKKVSESIVNLPEQYLKHVLTGYIDGDGYSNSSGGLIVTTASRDLAYQFFYMLLSLGCISSINEYFQNMGPNNREGLTKIYRIQLGSSQISPIKDCGFKCKKSIYTASDKGIATRIMGMLTEDGKFSRHVSYEIEKIHFVGDVYNFETESGSYVANNTSVHNCSHIKNLKGRKFTGRVTDTKTGQTKEVKDAPVFEDNYGIRFIELSGVVDPACASCKIKDVYQNDKLSKAATNCANTISVLQTSDNFHKNASKEDVDKLNQALNILQEIAIKLIQNRANIEMEFSADIVKILADLQEYVDGLVQAGFGKLPDAPQGIPGNVPSEQAGQSLPALGSEVQSGSTQPISQETPLGEVGQVSGTEGAPLTTPPATPEAVNNLDQTMRPSPKQPAKNMGMIKPKPPVRKASEDGENSEMRRIPTKISEQKSRVSNILETNWQEKLENFSNSLKESLKVELASNDKQVKTGSIGGTIMATKITQEAAKSKEAPLAVMEKRLEEEKGGLHPRTNKVVEDVEGKQLSAKHKGEENVTEQALLEKARTDDTPEEVEEKVLEPARQGDTSVETEQVKLEKQRVNKEPNSTMENLLGDSKNDSPSTRSSSSISDCVKLAVNTIAKAVICSQSTPERVIKIAGSLSSLPLSEQTTLINKIASYNGENTSYDDFKKRASFWADKGLQVTSASDKEIKDMIVTFAGKSVNDSIMNPELVVRAFAVLKNNPNSVAIVENKVKTLLAEGNFVQKDVEEQMNEQLSGMFSKEAKAEKCPKCGKWPFQGCKCKKDEGEKEEKDGEDKEEEKDKETNKCSTASVKSETLTLSKAIEKEAKNSSSLIIETNFKEMGLAKELQDNDQAVASFAEAFARGACAHLGVKVAAVVNVTVDGEGGDVVIAVDTAEGSVEIPVGGEKEDEPELPELPELPEASDASATETPDLGTETTPEAGAATTPPMEGSQDFGATTPPPAPAAGGGIDTMTSSKKAVKTAQMGGGSPGPGAGNDPNAPTGKSVDPTAEIGAPPPGEGEGLQTFTDEEDELPGDEEQKEPGSICFICGSTDTETGRKDQSPGQFDCNNCGAKYSIHVNVEVLNPEELIGDKGDLETELEEPTGPSMPVAAEVSLDRDMLKKIAKNQKDIGHICPACGGLEVEASGEPSDLNIKCNKCKTESTKSVLINVDNPLESVMRVAWSLDPMKRKCKSCRDNAKSFAASRVFSKMLKNASAVKEFPEAKVRGWLKTTYPNVEVVNNGPHKGQSFADTVVGQLKKFGLLKNKYLVALAEVQAKDDPMDVCIKDNKKKGYTLAESQKLCDCLKQKYASEEDDNIYIQAFGNKETFKTPINVGILRKMAEHDSKKLTKVGTDSKIQIDEEASLDSLPDTPAEKTLSQEELVKGIQEDVSLFPEKSEAKVSAKSKKDVKTAADFKNPPPDVAKKGDETKTKYVDNKDKNVKGDGIANKDNHMIDKEMKASPSRSAIGDELTEQIPGPKIPTGDATMGKEKEVQKDITKEVGVKVPSKETETDTSALGQSEASNEGDKMKKQAYGEGEPSKRVKDPVLKNPDSTSGDTALQQKKDTEKKVQVVDTAKGDADVPRGEAHINDENRVGNEGPKVPRGDAKMGNEAPPEAKEVSIPSEVSDTQVQMTGRNTTEAERQNQLEKIAAVRREHAMKYAGQLLEKGLIKENDVEEFVNDLSAMPLDRMKVHVAMILKATNTPTKTVQASQPASPTLTTAIVKEAQTITEPVADNEPTLTEKLASCFTIGGKEYNRHIRMDMAEKEKEDNLFSAR